MSLTEAMTASPFIFFVRYNQDELPSPHPPAFTPYLANISRNRIHVNMQTVQVLVLPLSRRVHSLYFTQIDYCLLLVSWQYCFRISKIGHVSLFGRHRVRLPAITHPPCTGPGAKWVISSEQDVILRHKAIERT